MSAANWGIGGGLNIFWGAEMSTKKPKTPQSNQEPLEKSSNPPPKSEKKSERVDFQTCSWLSMYLVGVVFVVSSF